MSDTQICEGVLFRGKFTHNKKSNHEQKYPETRLNLISKSVTSNTENQKQKIKGKYRIKKDVKMNTMTERKNTKINDNKTTKNR